MEIINPWFFYWINVCDKLQILLCIIGVVLFVINLVRFIGIWSDFSLEDAKPAFIATCFSLLIIIISIFIPNEETMYKMIAAKYITTDVLNQGVDAINNMTNKILEITSN